MQNVLHLVTYRFYPEIGGLEASVLRIARLCQTIGDTEVVVYVRSDKLDYEGEHALPDVRVYSLGRRRQALEGAQPAGIAALFEMDDARQQLEAQILQNLLARRMDETPAARHILVSFGLTVSGIIAQHTATFLAIKHIAAVRGSDFALGIYNPLLLPIVEYVSRRADLILTTNRTQAGFLGTAFQTGGRINTIHNSLTASELTATVSGNEVRRPMTPPLRLVADCGYAYKKGTHILLDAFERLVDEGLNIHLSLVGADEPQKERHWASIRRKMVAERIDRVALGNYLPRTEIPEFIRSGDIYCHATLAEGCSQARMMALALGMPIVSTRNAELLDLAEGAPHVKLAQPGDLDSFTDALREMCQAALSGQLRIDRERVARWRDYFAPEREVSEWRQALAHPALN